MAENESKPSKPKKRGGLGSKGRSLLLDFNENDVIEEGEGKDTGAGQRSGQVMISIDKIIANQNQPRKNFDEEALDELTASVKEYGILNPLIVQMEGDKYKIVAGERRLRAARKAGLTEVPVTIRNYTDQLAAEISIIENVQRADLNPMEEAMAYQMLSQDYGLKQEEIASRVSKNRTTITNAMRLLKLTEPVQELIAQGTLSAGHGRTLIGIEDPELQLQLANKMIQEEMNVRQAEKLIKTAVKALQKKEAEAEKDEQDEQDEKAEKQKSLFFKEYEEDMRTILGTKVHIQRRDKNKGKIEIEYYSTSELERLMELFRLLNRE